MKHKSWFEREFFGSAGRTRTYEPWVNRVRALLLKMQDLRLVSGEKTQSPAARIWWYRAHPHPLLILEPECKRIPCGNPSRRRKAMGAIGSNFSSRLRGTVTCHDRRQQSCSLPPTGRLSGARSDCQAAPTGNLEHREPEVGLRLLPRGDGTQSGASSRYTGGPQQTAKSAEAPQVTSLRYLPALLTGRPLDFRASGAGRTSSTGGASSSPRRSGAGRARERGCLQKAETAAALEWPAPSFACS